MERLLDVRVLIFLNAKIMESDPIYGIVMKGDGTVADRYFIQDHLGSSAGTFVNGVVETRAAYNVWGERINSGTLAQSGWDTSQRGFTGHEHLATYGLIHMNGRIYDAVLGRFLQADPIIQEPYNLQSYNRYSYVMNNPLAYTDPTGYSRWTRIRDRVIKPIAIAVAAYFTAGYVASVYLEAGAASAEAAAVVAGTSDGGIAAASFGMTSVSGGTLTYGGIANAIGGAAGGFAAGGLQGGNLNSALQGAVTGGISGGVNGYFGNTYNWSRVATESVVGGVNSTINGGSFRDGFRRGATISLLTYGNWAMRQEMIAQSKLNPTGANANGVSGGFMGDGKSLAGARAEYDTNGVKLPCVAPLGGCQGLANIANGDDPKNFFGLKYLPNSLPDRVNESFAGPHDWFRNMTGAYDEIGNSRNVTGFALKWDSFMNFANLIPAAPFAIAGFIHTQTPSVYYLYGSKK